MQNDEIYNSLTAVGFNNKEIRVYLAVLSLGQSTVSRIARVAAINRTTVYDILRALEDKGLVVLLGKEPKQEYRAEKLDQLEELYRNKIKQNENFLNIVKELKPQLESVRAVSDRPVVRFYEGEEGLKHVYEDTLTSHETIRAYASVENMHAGLPGYFPKYYKRRVEKGVKIRAIVPDTSEGKERAKQDTYEMRETALVPRDKYSFSPEINIYDNKVMIASWKEKMGIIIESKEIADAMKKIYELAWAESKRLDKVIKPSR